MKRTRVIIGGRVQGVGFRYFVLDTAQRYEIKGYVRNMPGGSVEVDAEGEREQLERFLHECRQGPPQARVDSFRIEDVPPYGYTRFRIKHGNDY
ncbi:MAG: acylphosphatase [Marinilabilia sp.]